MNPDDTEVFPKYGCHRCGSAEVRGDFDTYQVYQAAGDKLIHLRSEFTDPAVLALYCNACGAGIQIDDRAGIEIE